MKMKKKLLGLVAASVLVAGMATPSFANDAVNSGVAFLGSATALIVDIPEGILTHSLWHCPMKTTRYLADKFGDSKGWGQNIVGFVLGAPTGFVWGIPCGAIHGGRHALSVGWDKPFSTDSFLVKEEAE